MSRTGTTMAVAAVAGIFTLLLIGGLIWWGMGQSSKANKFESAAIQNAQALDRVQESQQKNQQVQDVVDDDSKDITRKIVELERYHARKSLERWMSIQPEEMKIPASEMEEIDNAK